MDNLFLLASFAVADLAAEHYFGVGGLEVAGAIELLVLAKAADGLDLGIVARARRLVARWRKPTPAEQ